MLLFQFRIATKVVQPVVLFIRFNPNILKCLAFEGVRKIFPFALVSSKVIKCQSADFIFIGPESDHWQCLSVTQYDWLTHCRLVDLIDVTLAYEDAYSKLVEVVTVADVYDEDHVGNSLLQIWKMRFSHKAKLLLRLEAQDLVKILSLSQ